MNSLSNIHVILNYMQLFVDSSNKDKRSLFKLLGMMESQDSFRDQLAL